MKTFRRGDLERFLEAIDAVLTQSLEIVIIGGSAAALRYGVTQATRDIVWGVMFLALIFANRQPSTFQGPDHGRKGAAV